MYVCNLIIFNIKIRTELINLFSNVIKIINIFQCSYDIFDLNFEVIRP